MTKKVTYNIYVDDKNDGKIGKKSDKLVYDSKIKSGFGVNSTLGSETYAGNILSWIAVDVEKEASFFKEYESLRFQYLNKIHKPMEFELKGQTIDLGDGSFYQFSQRLQLVGYYRDLFGLLDRYSVQYGLMVYDYLFDEFFRPRFHNDLSYFEVFKDYSVFKVLGTIYYRSFSEDLKLEMQNKKSINNLRFWKEFEKVYSEGSWILLDYPLESRVRKAIRRELRFARNGKSTSEKQFWNKSHSTLFSYNALMESIGNQIESDFVINTIYYDSGIFNSLESFPEYVNSEYSKPLDKVDSKVNWGIQISDLIVSLVANGLKLVQKYEQLYSNGYIKQSLFLTDNPVIWDGVFSSKMSRYNQNLILRLFSKMDLILSRSVIENASSLHMAPYLEEFISLRDYYNGVVFVLSNDIVVLDEHFKKSILTSHNTWDYNLCRARNNRLPELKRLLLENS